MTIITESKENNATYTSDMMQRKVFTPLRGKCAYRKEWHKNPIDLIDVPGGENVGLLLEHAGLVDVDLDSKEAEQIVPQFINTDTLAAGRGNKIRRYLYRGEIKNRSFEDLTGDKLLEIRHKGKQFMCPPSIHPDPPHERIKWLQDREPAEVPDVEEICKAATSVLIARYLPADGRHDLAMAYAGFLLRNGLDEDDVYKILAAAWEFHSAPQEAYEDIQRIIEDTREKIENDEPATGGNTLTDLIPGMTHQISKYWNWDRKLTHEEKAAQDRQEREARADQAWDDMRVQELAHDPNILNRIYKIMQDGGLVGEEKNAKLLSLTAATMHLGRPQSLLLNDNSSTGKSFLLKQLVKTLPEWMVYVVQSVSQQGLAYLGETALKGRFFIPYELGGLGNKESDSLEQIKGLITEGSIIRASVKDHEGHVVKVEGPTGVLTTSTKQFMDHELATRMFRVGMTNTPEHRRQVLKARTRRNSNEADYGPIRGLHTYLAGQDNRVVVPFEEELTERVAVNSERIVRDHERLSSSRSPPKKHLRLSLSCARDRMSIR
jgi:hypothetical protein